MVRRKLDREWKLVTALGKRKTEQSKKPALCYVPSGPSDFSTSSFVSKINTSPIRDLTVNSAPTSNHIHKSQGCVPGHPWEEGRQRSSEPWGWDLGRSSPGTGRRDWVRWRKAEEGKQAGLRTALKPLNWAHQGETAIPLDQRSRLTPEQTNSRKQPAPEVKSVKLFRIPFPFVFPKRLSPHTLQSPGLTRPRWSSSCFSVKAAHLWKP